MYRKNERVRTRERRRKQLMLIAEAACCVVLAVVIGCILLRHWKHQQRMQEQSEAQEIMTVLNEENTASEAAEAQSVSANVSATTPLVFEAAQQLLDQNPDFVGMVGFDDMALYVCQSTDNTFYASHRFDGSSDAAGMIYMDCRCSLWPLSDNTILYGHNMRDGSRFGKLKRMANMEYVEANPIIRFASLYEIHEYTPIAIFYADADSNEETFDWAQIHFQSSQDYENYIESITNRSILKLQTEAQYGDSLLTLVTCSERETGNRLIVVCVEQ